MKEIESEVAKRLNIDEEQVHVVISDMFKEVRSYLQKPDLVKHGILLHKFIRIELNYNSIERYIEYREANPNAKTRQYESIEYYKNILNKKDYYGNSKK